MSFPPKVCLAPLTGDMLGSARFSLIALPTPAMVSLGHVLQGQYPAHSKYLINMCEGRCEPDKDCIVLRNTLGSKLQKATGTS